MENTESKGRKSGGRIVHLDPDTAQRVEEYREDFETDHPGIAVSTGEAMANLIHRGLERHETGPFTRIVHPADMPIPYSPAETDPVDLQAVKDLHGSANVARAAAELADRPETAE